jgi:hypothetical protein
MHLGIILEQQRQPDIFRGTFVGQSFPKIVMSYVDGHVQQVKLETLWNYYWNSSYTPPANRPSAAGLSPRRQAGRRRHGALRARRVRALHVGQQADRADAITAVSLENASVRVEITILWHLVGSAASNVYRSLGTSYKDVIVRPVSRSAVRDCISKFRFELARTSQRPDVERCIEESLNGEFVPRGLAVDGVQLRNIAATVGHKLAEGDPLLLQFVRTTSVPTGMNEVFEMVCTAKFQWRLGEVLFQDLV